MFYVFSRQVKERLEKFGRIGPNIKPICIFPKILVNHMHNTGNVYR